MIRLLQDLTAVGVEVSTHGDRLRYSPRAAASPDLVGRLRAHKAELLAALNEPSGDGDTTPSKPEEKPGSVAVATVNGFECDPDGWPVDSIDADAVTPCPVCGSLELWESLMGGWRCMRCDPPTVPERRPSRRSDPAGSIRREGGSNLHRQKR